MWMPGNAFFFRGMSKTSLAGFFDLTDLTDALIPRISFNIMNYCARYIYEWIRNGENLHYD